MSDIKTPDDVITFWRKAGRDKWFNRDDAFDAAIRDNFLSTYEDAHAGKLKDWQNAPETALALAIVLDQFPRNMFRSDPRAWQSDGQARAVARHALERGFDQQVPEDVRTFFYLPLMHSETLHDQEQCVALYEALGDENSLEYAKIHAEVIRRFGRFPHRNRVLGRETTPEEQAFLEAGGFAG